MDSFDKFIDHKLVYTRKGTELAQYFLWYHCFITREIINTKERSTTIDVILEYFKIADKEQPTYERVKEIFLKNISFVEQGNKKETFRIPTNIDKNYFQAHFAKDVFESASTITYIEKTEDGVLKTVTINHKEVSTEKIDELIYLPNYELNKSKGLPSKLIPDLVREINFSYKHKKYNSSVIVCRRVCEILVIESLNVYNEKLDDDEKIMITDHVGYLGFGTLLKKFKSCNFPDVKKEIVKCLENVKKYGDIGAHDKFMSVNEDDINNYIKPDISRTITILLQISEFFSHSEC